MKIGEKRNCKWFFFNLDDKWSNCEMDHLVNNERFPVFLSQYSKISLSAAICEIKLF